MLPVMDAAPALDATKPSSLRLVGFALSMIGAVLIGYGATTTWITVGNDAGGNTDTVIPGIDLIDGVVALVCAVVVLVGVLGTRMASGIGARKVLASIAIAAGFVAFALGGAFLLVGTSRSAVIEGEPADVELVFGAGPSLVLLGGILAFVGGILSLAWASRISDPDPVSVRSTDDPTPAPS